MINRIPPSLLSKMCMSNTEIHGSKVNVSVVDDSAVVADKLQEIVNTGHGSNPSARLVVGFDVKYIQATGSQTGQAKLLILCYQTCFLTRCLIIQLCHLDRIPDVLIKLLADKTICFLGIGMNNIVTVAVAYLKNYSAQCTTGVEVGHLAARILKKPNIENYGLAKLACEVGMNIKEPIGESPNWNARVFSEEQIKYAMHNAYTSFLIGKKLFEML